MIDSVLIGVIGPWQIILILALALLLFGGKKIPELMKGLGQGIREFKSGMNNPDSDKTKPGDKEEEKK